MQIDLLTDPKKLARRSDPATSHAAAERAMRFAGSHRQQVLDALCEHGPMTVDMIAKRTGLKSQQINKRTPDLERAGLIELTGRELPSDSGCPEREWRAIQ